MKRATPLGQDSALSVALFAVPAALLFLVFLVLPLLVAAGATLTNHRLVSPEKTEFVGLANFQRLLSLKVVTVAPLADAKADAPDRYPTWRALRTSRPELQGYREAFRVHAGDTRIVLAATDPLFYRSLFNTFVFAAMVIPLQCGMALGLALLVNQKVRGRTFFRTVYFSPVVTSMVIVSIVWSFMLNTDRGMINELLRVVTGDPNAGPDWLGEAAYAMPAIAVMSAWQGAGFQMLIFLAGLQSISPELYEAATLMGANAWQRFVYVTLPGLRNTLIFVLVSTTIMAFGLFTQVDVMTSGGPLDSTSTVIYHAVRTGFRQQDVGYGSTVALVFFFMVLAASLLQHRLTTKGDRP